MEHPVEPTPAPKSKPNPIRRAWKTFAKEVAIAIVVLAAVGWWQARNAASGPAPALVGEGLRGPVSLASMQGGPVVVHFWATWCGVCSAEEGNVERVAKAVPTITVAVHSGDADDVRTHLEKRGLSFDAVIDPDSAIARRWGVSAFPTTFFVGEDGQISSVSVGYTSTLGMRARAWLAGL